MKIILCDQDGVLFNKTYSCNYLFKELNKLLTDNNAIIVPNSDTPVLRLKNNFESITGLKIDTLIAERGAIIVHNGKETPTINFFSNELESYKKMINDLALKFKVEIYNGDSATWMKNNKTFSPDKNVIIFDSFRKTALGYYARRTNNNGLAIVDNIFYNEFTSEAKKIVKPKWLDVEDYNQSYGIVILSSSRATKTLGVKYLIEILGENHKYYMIGDSKTDIINNQNITHLAVNNCDELLKNKAEFVSPSEFTKGMMECIDYALQIK